MRSINPNLKISKSLNAVLGFGGIVLLSLAGITLLGQRSGRGIVLAQGAGLQGDDIGTLERLNRAYERIADAVTPSIVNIQTTQVIKVQQSPFFSDPFFRQFFGNQFGPFNIPREQKEHALGSGVIVSPDGYIVTNNHVVAKASEIQVMLSDKRVFKAKVIGADPETDVAVVKIDAHGVPAAVWGDSSTLKVGDSVMAFGNPFGLNFTVTRGIVSAVGRAGLGIESFEDFIQTDAAINPGNSGGALVDIHGRVVGINTAIVSGGAGAGEAGSNGIGLAIPASIVKHVMESLIKTGKVERGYLGVTVGDLSEKLASQFKAPDISGALVEDVSPDSPAGKAGLEQGDVIRSVDGSRVESKDQLTSTIASMTPGSKVKLGILREGKQMTIEVVLGTRPTNLPLRAGEAKAPSKGTLRGMTVENLTPRIIDQLGLPAGTFGVVVTKLDPDSPAAQEGLQPGDVIQEIDHNRVKGVRDFDRLAATATGEVLLRIVRQGSGLFVVLSPMS
jgi:Do/DeqQ family serine protease